MPAYSYRATSTQGEETGTAEATDKLALARELREEGKTLLSAEKEGAEEERRTLDDLLPFMGGVSLEDKLMFARNLRIMVVSGVSLTEALQTLSSQADSDEMKEALEDMAQRLREGYNFSEAVQAHSQIFSPLFYHMVRTGEEAGTLEQSLRNIATHLRRQHELRSQIKGAMIYPSVIIGVMGIIAVLMLTLVVPKLAGVFEELDVELPATTQLVIQLGSFVRTNAIIGVLGLLAAFLGIRLLFRSDFGKQWRDTLSLKTPVIGEIVQKVNASYIMRTLSVLLSSGVSFVRSLYIVAGVVPNVHYKAAMETAQERIQRGEELSAILQDFPALFPPTVLQMMHVGEETGETSQVLHELAEFYEEEVNTATQNLVSIIEPVLMVVIGAVVAFFAISMIQPMYSMIGQI